MKNTKNKFNAVDYVNQMNHLYSNGPKPRGDTIQQLLDLKEWSLLIYLNLGPRKWLKDSLV